MGTKKNPGAFDCYANADPDEPMFVLLGRDRHAPGLVRLWALLRAQDGEDAAKVAEALACADAMDAELDKLRGLGMHVVAGTAFQKLFVVATEGMDEHPEGFNEYCECDMCRSYD